VRYRQGCRCPECETAESAEINKINIEEIPKMGAKEIDLEMLKFRLIQS
jgi:hypothetical protein